MNLGRSRKQKSYLVISSPCISTTGPAETKDQDKVQLEKKEITKRYTFYLLHFDMS